MKLSSLTLLFCIVLMGRLAAQTDSLNSIINNNRSSTSEKLKAYGGLAAYYSLKDFDKTIALGEEAAKLVKSKEDSAAYAVVLHHVGIGHYFKGNYDKAADYYFKALHLFEEGSNKKELGNTLNDIAKLYRKTRDLDQSLRYYDRAMDVFKSMNDSEGMQMIWNESGVVFEYKEDFPEAIRRYTESLKIAEARKDLVGVGYAKSFIAGVQVIQKNFKPAEVNLLEALKIRENLKDSFAVALTQTDLGVLYNASGDYQKAIKAFELSNKTAATLKYAELQSANYRELSSIAASMGDDKSALKYYQQYTSIKDSLFNLDKNKQIVELNTKYETEKKEQQIMLQNSQLSLQQSEIVRKNITLVAVIVLSVLAFLLVYSGYKRYQLKQATLLQQERIVQQELATRAVLEAEERERQRIAKDLHDGVGQMMSAAKMNLSSIEPEIAFRGTDQKNRFDKIIQLVDESCKEVRTVSHNMMPNALLKSGLASAIREFIDKIDDRIIKVDLYSEGLNERLDINTETVLYRVIQECVNNVIKHAQANHLDISLIKDRDGISATIEDNGKGFDTSKTDVFEGIGLKNIRTRVEFLKGEVDFNSEPGKGTLVAIHIPGN
ncbi:MULTISPECIES: tetratricopeptide repeat-containing sensor histidine kinase [unclassified Paraflavitalea]|uniref:tetratricopeptide repeat-containing sensor histidine kinase n=1 Tax=unclassified Paraflavitalea TaxID=2798305 RepID=UPI003D3332A6